MVTTEVRLLRTLKKPGAVHVNGRRNHPRAGAAPMVSTEPSSRRGAQIGPRAPEPQDQRGDSTTGTIDSAATQPGVLEVKHTSHEALSSPPRTPVMRILFQVVGGMAVRFLPHEGAKPRLPTKGEARGDIQMRGFAWKAVLTFTVTCLIMPAFAGTGTVIDIAVHSPSLESNLLGDSADRVVSIYLPPDYDLNATSRYPVLYLLHGYTLDEHSWLETGNIDTTADALIDNSTIQPLIIVMPNGNNSYGGSWYVNSPVTGDWEDFIVHDLVTYIDSHYRTIARPESRAIAGHSMGGFGALSIATRHPETFRVVYAMSPYPLDFMDSDTSTLPFEILATNAAIADGTYGTGDRIFLSLAAAFSPDPGNPPTYVDLPYDRVDNKLHKVDAVWDRWVAHTPLAMLSDHAENLRQFNAIGFDVATGDDTDIVNAALPYAQALTGADIPFQLELYEGGHRGQIAPRLKSVVLPYVAQHLQGETAHEASDR